MAPKYIEGDELATSKWPLAESVMMRWRLSRNITSLYKSRGGGGSNAHHVIAEVRKIFEYNEISECVWVSVREGGNAELYPEIGIDGAQNITNEWRNLWGAFTNASGGGLQYWVKEVSSILARNIIKEIPDIHIIPAKRIVGKKNENFDDLSGKGLIDHLAALQNPAWDKQEDKAKFAKINEFLQDVVGKEDAVIEIPDGREHVLVHMDNKVLPLESLGSGIHEVILIAAFCTIFDESIMCIEEPEIHLHPLLQRKLVEYLSNKTKSQYFIATHSPTFIDSKDSSVFHVENDGESTRVKIVIDRLGGRRILDKLGARASDILQSNMVIWVEGPSDRIYLKYWIGAIDGRLREGIHYTIMFYGGALIRHLTASDDAVDEFIKLRDINSNMAVVIDSDRSSADTELKPHAKRLLEEMNGSGALVWVTDGREIENYIDGEKLQDALKKVHPKLYRAPGKTGKFDNAFYFYRESSKKPGTNERYKDADKVGVANKVCSEEANLDVLDLRQRVEELVAMIRKANGLHHSGA